MRASRRATTEAPATLRSGLETPETERIEVPAPTPLELPGPASDPAPAPPEEEPARPRVPA